MGCWYKPRFTWFGAVLVGLAVFCMVSLRFETRARKAALKELKEEAGLDLGIAISELKIISQQQGAPNHLSFGVTAKLAEDGYHAWVEVHHLLKEPDLMPNCRHVLDHFRLASDAPRLHRAGGCWAGTDSLQTSSSLSRTHSLQTSSSLTSHFCPPRHGTVFERSVGSLDHVVQQ